MMSLATLVLTITMVVVQLAMGQFSPRIVQRILRDKPSQLAIGLFVATFVHAVLTIREVLDKGDGTGQVPGIAVATSYVLVLASIAALVMYVHHIGQSLRVSALIELVGDETRKLVDRLYPDAGPPVPVDAEAPHIVEARESGVVTMIGTDALVAEAERAGCVLELVPALGAFVPAGGALFLVHGDPSEPGREPAPCGAEPEARADSRRGRRLRDAAARRHRRALALRIAVPGSRRPLCRRSTGCTTSSGSSRGGRSRTAGSTTSAGELRLLVTTMSWEDYVHLAFDEIRMVGAGSPQVSRRLKAALDDLRSVAPLERVDVLDKQLELLVAATQRAMDDEQDVDMALHPDREGIGAAVGAEA